MALEVTEMMASFSFSRSGLCGQRGCQGYANIIILVLTLYRQSEHVNVQGPCRLQFGVDT